MDIYGIIYTKNAALFPFYKNFIIYLRRPALAKAGSLCRETPCIRRFNYWTIRIWKRWRNTSKALRLTRFGATGDTSIGNCVPM